MRKASWGGGRSLATNETHPPQDTQLPSWYVGENCSQYHSLLELRPSSSQAMKRILCPLEITFLFLFYNGEESSEKASFSFVHFNNLFIPSLNHAFIKISNYFTEVSTFQARK